MKSRYSNAKTVRGASNLKLIGSVLGLGILVIGGAVMLGRSDSGVIDVSATITRSNITQSAEGGDGTSVPVVPSEFSNMPNGGLVPQRNQGAVDTPPPAPAPTERASSSDAATEDARGENGPVSTSEGEVTTDDNGTE